MKIHLDKELYYLYTSLIIVWVIKSWGIKQTEHVARMGEMRNHAKFQSENLDGGFCLEDVHLNERK